MLSVPWKILCKKPDNPSPDPFLSLSETQLKLSRILIEINDLVWQKMGDYAPNYPGLNQAEKDFLHVSYLKGQVDNGGFDQFFFNGSGDYCYEILEALQRIKAFRMLSIVSSAFDLFPQQPIPENSVRRIIMETLDENISHEWNKLDKKFYYYGEDLETLLLKYILDHPEHVGSELIQKDKNILESVIERMQSIPSTNIFMTEGEIKKGVKALGKGESLISFRRKLIDSGIESTTATYIARESFRRTLTQSGRTKIIRGSIWFTCGIMVTLFIFLLTGKIYYLLSFATLWGGIQIFKGYSLLVSARNL